MRRIDLGVYTLLALLAFSTLFVMHAVAEDNGFVWSPSVGDDGFVYLASSVTRIVITPGSIIVDHEDPFVIHLVFAVWGRDVDRMYYARSSDGGKTWSTPVLVAEYRHEGSPPNYYNEKDT